MVQITSLSFLAIAAAALVSGAAITARDADGVHCDISGTAFNADDAKKAWALLAADCDAYGQGFVPAAGASYWGKSLVKPVSRTYGTALAYVCNYKQSADICHSYDVNSNLNDVLGQCKSNAGWFNHGSWGPMTYGIIHSGSNVVVC